jgi:hypothetical protein
MLRRAHLPAAARIAAAVVAVVLSGAPPALACSVCGCGDPLLTSTGAWTKGFHYTHGSAALWSVHGQSFPVKRVALDLGVDGRHAAADQTAGEPVENTGGTVLAAAPGVYLDATGSAWLFVRGQVPFYKHFRGAQDQLPSIVTGLQYQLR